MTDPSALPPKPLQQQPSPGFEPEQTQQGQQGTGLGSVLPQLPTIAPPQTAMPFQPGQPLTPAPTIPKTPLETEAWFKQLTEELHSFARMQDLEFGARILGAGGAQTLEAVQTENQKSEEAVSAEDFLRQSMMGAGAGWRIPDERAGYLDQIAELEKGGTAPEAISGLQQLHQERTAMGQALEVDEAQIMESFRQNVAKMTGATGQVRSVGETFLTELTMGMAGGESGTRIEKVMGDVRQDIETIGRRRYAAPELRETRSRLYSTPFPDPVPGMTQEAYTDVLKEAFISKLRGDVEKMPEFEEGLGEEWTRKAAAFAGMAAPIGTTVRLGKGLGAAAGRGVARFTGKGAIAKGAGWVAGMGGAMAGMGGVGYARPMAEADKQAMEDASPEDRDAVETAIRTRNAIELGATLPLWEVSMLTGRGMGAMLGKPLGAVGRAVGGTAGMGATMPATGEAAHATTLYINKILTENGLSSEDMQRVMAKTQLRKMAGLVAHAGPAEKLLTNAWEGNWSGAWEAAIDYGREAVPAMAGLGAFNAFQAAFGGRPSYENAPRELHAEMTKARSQAVKEIDAADLPAEVKTQLKKQFNETADEIMPEAPEFTEVEKARQELGVEAADKAIAEERAVAAFGEEGAVAPRTRTAEIKKVETAEQKLAEERSHAESFEEFDAITKIDWQSEMLRTKREALEAEQVARETATEEPGLSRQSQEWADTMREHLTALREAGPGETVRKPVSPDFGAGRRRAMEELVDMGTAEEAAAKRVRAFEKSAEKIEIKRTQELQRTIKESRAEREFDPIVESQVKETAKTRLREVEKQVEELREWAERFPEPRAKGDLEVAEARLEARHQKLLRVEAEEFLKGAERGPEAIAETAVQKALREARRQGDPTEGERFEVQERLQRAEMATQQWEAYANRLQKWQDAGGKGKKPSFPAGGRDVGLPRRRFAEVLRRGERAQLAQRMETLVKPGDIISNRGGQEVIRVIRKRDNGWVVENIDGSQYFMRAADLTANAEFGTREQWGFKKAIPTEVEMQPLKPVVVEGREPDSAKILTAPAKAPTPVLEAPKAPEVAEALPVKPAAKPKVPFDLEQQVAATELIGEVNLEGVDLKATSAKLIEELRAMEGPYAKEILAKAESLAQRYPAMKAAKLAHNASYEVLKSRLPQELQLDLDHRFGDMHFSKVVEHLRGEFKDYRADPKAFDSWLIQNWDIMYGPAAQLTSWKPMSKLQRDVKTQRDRLVEAGYIDTELSIAGGAKRVLHAVQIVLLGPIRNMGKQRLEPAIIKEALGDPLRKPTTILHHVSKILPDAFARGFENPMTTARGLATDGIRAMSKGSADAHRTFLKFFHHKKGLLRGVEAGSEESRTMHRMLREGPESKVWTSASADLKAAAHEMRDFYRQMRDKLSTMTQQGEGYRREMEFAKTNAKIAKAAHEKAVTQKANKGWIALKKQQMEHYEERAKWAEDGLNTYEKSWGQEEYTPDMMLETLDGFETKDWFRMPDGTDPMADRMKARSQHMKRNRGILREKGIAMEDAVQSFFAYSQTMPFFLRRSEFRKAYETKLYGELVHAEGKETVSRVKRDVEGNEIRTADGTPVMEQHEVNIVSRPQDKVVYREAVYASRGSLQEIKTGAGLTYQKAPAEGAKPKVILWRGQDALSDAQLGNPSFVKRHTAAGTLVPLDHNQATMEMRIWKGGMLEAIEKGHPHGDMMASRIEDVIDKLFKNTYSAERGEEDAFAGPMKRKVIKTAANIAAISSANVLGGPVNVRSAMTNIIGGTIHASFALGRVPLLNPRVWSLMLKDLQTYKTFAPPEIGEKLEGSIFSEMGAEVRRELLAQHTPEQAEARAAWERSGLVGTTRADMPTETLMERMGGQLRGLSKRAKKDKRYRRPARPGKVSRRGVVEAAKRGFWAPFTFSETMVRKSVFYDQFTAARDRGASIGEAERIGFAGVHQTQMVFNAVAKSGFQNNPVGRIFNNIYTWGIHAQGRQNVMFRENKVEWGTDLLWRTAAYWVGMEIFGMDFANWLGTTVSNFETPGGFGDSTRDAIVAKAFGLGEETEEDPQGIHMKGALWDMGWRDVFVPFIAPLGYLGLGASPAASGINDLMGGGAKVLAPTEDLTKAQKQMKRGQRNFNPLEGNWVRQLEKLGVWDRAFGLPEFFEPIAGSGQTYIDPEGRQIFRDEISGSRVVTPRISEDPVGAALFHMLPMTAETIHWQASKLERVRKETEKARATELGAVTADIEEESYLRRTGQASPFSAESLQARHELRGEMLLKRWAQRATKAEREAMRTVTDPSTGKTRPRTRQEMLAIGVEWSKTLTDDDPAVGEIAAKVLEFASARTQGRMVGALRSIPDTRLRNITMSGSVARGTKLKQIVEYLESDADIRMRDIDTAIKAGFGGWEKFVKLLNENPDIADRALDALGKRGFR